MEAFPNYLLQAAEDASTLYRNSILEPNPVKFGQ